MSTDPTALARELRHWLLTEPVSTAAADAMRRAADALEARCAADREPLAQWLYDDQSSDLGPLIAEAIVASYTHLPWKTLREESKEVWRAFADRLLASGIIQYIPATEGAVE